MKKIFFHFFLLSGLLLSLFTLGTACSRPLSGTAPSQKTAASPAESVKEEAALQESSLLTDAPSMTIDSVSGEESDIRPAAWEWSYRNPDGTSAGSVACGSHPLEAANPDDFPAGSCSIEFPVSPDEITVRCWDSRYMGEDSDKYEGFYESVSLADNRSFEIEIGKLYEVTAEWHEGRSFSGNANYILYCPKG